MKFILSAVVVGILLMSCGTKSKKEEPGTTTLPNPIVVPATNASPVSGSLPVNSPGNQGVTVASTPTANPATTAASSTAGLNPAHGQPGHRCDISVGAPLNSAPTSPATSSVGNKTTTVSQPVITTTGSNPPAMTFTPQPQTKTITAPGMNPPHGEPGHRCDISVGAPLNSKPTVAAATTPTTPTIQTITTPPVIKTTPAKDSN